MAKNMQPYLKRCRTLGISPAVMGVNKESNRNPGPQRRSKKSEYALQLNEKRDGEWRTVVDRRAGETVPLLL